MIRRPPPNAGPPTSFEEALCPHLDALFGTALRLCGGHREDAEDLLQEATLRALDGFAGLRDPVAARAWLFQILIRTNLNRARSRRRHPEQIASDMTQTEFEHALANWQPMTTPEDDAASQHVRACVLDAVDALDPVIRAVVVLVDLQGFRQREVADMLAIPEGTVASRLFRGRCSLRDALYAIWPSEFAGGER